MDHPESVTIPGHAGVTLAADRWPGERSPVVLAHGGGQTRHAWGGTARALHQRGHEVVALDLRGHGDSGWAPDGDYDTEAFARDALAVIGWVGAPVHWVGASMGGLTGLRATALDDHGFRSLVLVDITARPAQAGVDRILEFMTKDLERGFGSLDEAADAIAAYQPHRPRRRDTSGLAKNLRRGEDGRWRWHWDPAFIRRRSDRGDAEGDYYENTVAAASALRIPTLLVRGRLSDLVTEEEARAFLELVPHADYVDVAGAAHMVAGDRNDRFTDAVVEFLERTDSDRTADGPATEPR